MTKSDKHLNRIPDEGMIAGVCAGVAEYFDIDVALVRAGFAALVVFSGFGVVAYLVLWFLLDPRPSADDSEVIDVDQPAPVEVSGSDEVDTTSQDAVPARESTTEDAT